MGDRFWSRLWQGVAPLVLWAAHFFFVYLYAAAGCGKHTWPVLLGVTLLALAVAGWLAWRAWWRWWRWWKWRARRASPPDGPPRGLLEAARRWAALLALAAIAWGTLPLLVFGGCG